MSDNPDLITEVEKYDRGWTGGRPETPCGFGSKLSQTKIQRDWIPAMVGKYNIRTIADIGAGDLNWIRKVEWPHLVTYTPYDLVPRDPSVIPLDIIHERPEKADLVICLWLLNHLPEDHARAALENLRGSGRYLMLTYESRQWAFTDIEPLETVTIRTRKDARGDVEIRLIKL